jgi:Ca-activated chloride channel homolog
MLTRLVALFFLWAAAAMAGARTPPPPTVRLIPAEPAAQPIQLRHLDIHSTISGGMAETTVKMEFYNPNHRQLEGNLQFPLADGQQITAFALDINGVMRPAVPVEKARGREVFEAIERRRVDPGLLEVTQGNNFKLRVYPIMPMSTRTVELRYAEPLVRRGASWVYRLPLEYGKVERMDLAIDAGIDEPQVGSSVTPLEFVRGKSGYQAQMKRERTSATGAIEILTRAHAEPRVYRQEYDNATWFLAEVPVQPVRTRRPAPRVIGLLWDSSGSGASRAIEAELAELDRYFTALGNVEVRLTRLRDRPEAQQVFRVAGGDWTALRRALASTVYDGAIALNDWQMQTSVDQYLLFSDGLSNYGGDQFPQLAPHQQLFALNSALSSDAGRLAGLAERYRGQLIQIQGATPGAAAQALLYQDARLDHISAAGATDIEVDSTIIGDGMLRVAGRWLSPEASLTLKLSNGGKLESVTVPLSAAGADHPRAAALWAGFRLRRLDADFELHRAEIGRIGRRFGIPTRETSLIVLEQLQDYVRYEIEPPAELMAQYRHYRSEADGRRAGERSKHIAQVVRMFEQRKAWWNASVDKNAYAPPKVRKEPAPVELQRSSPMLDSVVAAPAVPAAAPVAEMKAGITSNQRIEVTGSAIKRAHSPSAPAISIALQKWVPNAAYLDRLNKASADRVYQVYLDQKPDYANSSAFFLDAADILLAKGQRDLALRILSNLSEMDLENRAVLRILGYRLLQAGAPALAVPVFEHVMRIAGEEPQSFRDLGLALAAAGKPQQAIDTLYEVVLRPWDVRFPDIETITLAELNAIVAAARTPLDVSRIDKRLLANLPLDLRVVLTWDADNSDMDLYVTDPNGERCDYAHNRTSQGGRMSNDFTSGYGPEEFALRRAVPGKYRIEANYYGNRQQVVAGATTLQVKLFSGFGTARQKDQLITLRLKDQSETVFVGEFEVKR